MKKLKNKIKECIKSTSIKTMKTEILSYTIPFLKGVSTTQTQQESFALPHVKIVF